MQAEDTAVVLDNGGRTLPDRVEQFSTAIVAVDLPADAVVGVVLADRLQPFVRISVLSLRIPVWTQPVSNGVTSQL